MEDRTRKDLAGKANELTIELLKNLNPIEALAVLEMAKVLVDTYKKL